MPYYQWYHVTVEWLGHREGQARYTSTTGRQKKPHVPSGLVELFGELVEVGRLCSCNRLVLLVSPCKLGMVT